MPRPRKQFGQHWLRSEQALQQIIQAAQLSSGDRLLEIGPGTGILTERLLPLVNRLTAVEIDRDLCNLLAKKFQQAESFHLIEADILALHLEQNLTDDTGMRPNKVVANIPYYITGPILEKLLGTIAQPNPHPFETIVVLIQKEVADRLCAKPGSRIFGALSVRVQYLAECDRICTVPAKAFYPPPKVDSAVVRLSPRTLHPAAQSPSTLEQIVTLGFSAKRKMLRNNLKSFIESDRLTHLLEELNIDPKTRAEDLSPPQWVALSDRLFMET